MADGKSPHELRAYIDMSSKHTGKRREDVVHHTIGVLAGVGHGEKTGAGVLELAKYTLRTLYVER